jgi:hypothetical protein
MVEVKEEEEKHEKIEKIEENNFFVIIIYD